MKAVRLNRQSETHSIAGYITALMVDSICMLPQLLYNWFRKQIYSLRRIVSHRFIVRLINIRIIKIHLSEENY